MYLILFTMKEPDWPIKNDGTPVRDAMQSLDHGKDNCWTGDKTADHTIQILRSCLSVQWMPIVLAVAQALVGGAMRAVSLLRSQTFKHRKDV